MPLLSRAPSVVNELSNWPIAACRECANGQPAMPPCRHTWVLSSDRGLQRLIGDTAGLGDADGTTVQRLSRMAGNRFVAQLLADRPAPTPDATAVQRAGEAAAVQREEGASTVEAQAEEIYDALNWVNDVPRAMRALRAAHPNWVTRAGRVQ